MTTESQQDTPRGVSPLLGALGFGVVAVLALAFAGAVSSGRGAVVGALVGGVAALVILAMGTMSLSVVARVMPVASLLVALLTYTLQLLLLFVVMLAIERAGFAERTLSQTWFAAAVIAVTALWLVGQVVTTARSRIPVYDLPAAPHPGSER